MGAPHAGFIVMLLPAIAVVFVARDGGVVVVPAAAVGVVNMMVAVGTAVDVRPGENSKHDKKIIPQFKVYPKKKIQPRSTTRKWSVIFDCVLIFSLTRRFKYFLCDQNISIHLGPKFYRSNLKDTHRQKVRNANVDFILLGNTQFSSLAKYFTREVFHPKDKLSRCMHWL